jgi:hypothetical protein
VQEAFAFALPRQEKYGNNVLLAEIKHGLRLLLSCVRVCCVASLSLREIKRTQMQRNLTADDLTFKVKMKFACSFFKKELYLQE